MSRELRRFGYPPRRLGSYWGAPTIPQAGLAPARAQHLFTARSPIRAKFLYLGLPLDQVVELTPAAPARAIHEDRSLGTLQPGAAADVTVLSLVEGPVELANTMGEQVTAPRRLVPTAVVRAGRRITLQSRRSGAEG